MKYRGNAINDLRQEHNVMNTLLIHSFSPFLEHDFNFILILV